MIVKYKEIWEPRNEILKEEEKDLFFRYGEVEKKELIFCCDDLKIIQEHLDFYVSYEKNQVCLEAYPDRYDCSETYNIQFCPFCGEKFEFESLGKYERIIKEIKTRKIIYDTKTELKRLKE
jgi:hypothetical protein